MIRPRIARMIEMENGIAKDPALEYAEMRRRALKRRYPNAAARMRTMKALAQHYGDDFYENKTNRVH